MLVKGEAAPIQVAAKSGADCSGTHGTANRTLSITKVASEEIVFVQGAFLYPTLDYTKATVSSVSQFTFLKKVYDHFHIRIFYWT